jgi:hypothetical protein
MRMLSAALLCAQCLCLAAADAAEDREAVIARGIEALLSMEEGESGGEWPYEGVYRVRGEIPIGYRVGGAAIVASALLNAPQREGHIERSEAIERAAEFIAASIEHPLMGHAVEGGYDVRGWGYAYGLWFLLQAKAAGAIGEARAEQCDAAIEFFIRGIEATEIPAPIGGWNYARRGGFGASSPPSPFMTGATLQALFAACAAGCEVDHAVIERGLDALRRAKMDSGAYVYSGRASERSREGVPGAVGRMLIAESTLHLAGLATRAEVRSAIDAFIVHWEWLEKRRAREGTHAPPYGVAPYYFFFAHYYAAQAIELLPEPERAEYRRRVNALLLGVRGDESGTWNDRVFARSANYGTAMAAMALMMPELPPPARWESPQADAVAEVQDD